VQAKYDSLDKQLLRANLGKPVSFVRIADPTSAPERDRVWHR
jgi:hypothetical protein